jgi:hypothetical protein
MYENIDFESVPPVTAILFQTRESVLSGLRRLRPEDGFRFSDIYFEARLRWLGDKEVMNAATDAAVLVLEARGSDLGREVASFFNEIWGDDRASRFLQAVLACGADQKDGGAFWRYQTKFWRLLSNGRLKIDIDAGIIRRAVTGVKEVLYSQFPQVWGVSSRHEPRRWEMLGPVVEAGFIFPEIMEALKPSYYLEEDARLLAAWPMLGLPVPPNSQYSGQKPEEHPDVVSFLLRSAEQKVRRIERNPMAAYGSTVAAALDPILSGLLALGQSARVSEFVNRLPINLWLRRWRMVFLDGSHVEMSEGSKSQLEDGLESVLQSLGVGYTRGEKFNSYELDFTLAVVDGKSINLEVDGPHHYVRVWDSVGKVFITTPTLRVRDRWRDYSLGRNGFKVVRVRFDESSPREFLKKELGLNR